MGASIWASNSVALVPASSYVASERLIATAGQTLFNITAFTYQLGGQALRVFRNGQLMTIPDDYTETSTSSFTLTSGVNVGDELFAIGNSFVSPGAGYGNAANVMYDPAGGTQTTVQSKLRRIISVLDFGAVGDGVTDDSAAFQAAIDYLDVVAGNNGYLSSGCGGTILVPSTIAKTGEFGGYIINSTLNVRSGVTFQGDSKGSYITWGGAVNGKMFYLTDSATDQIADTNFYDLTLDGQDNAACAIFVDSTHNWVQSNVKRCQIRKFNAASGAITVQGGPWKVNIEDNSFTYCLGTAIQLMGQYVNFVTCRIVGNWFSTNGQAGNATIDLTYGQGILISNNQFENDHAGFKIRCQGTNNSIIVGNIFESQNGQPADIILVDDFSSPTYVPPAYPCHAMYISNNQHARGGNVAEVIQIFGAMNTTIVHEEGNNPGNTDIAADTAVSYIRCYAAAGHHAGEIAATYTVIKDCAYLGLVDGGVGTSVDATTATGVRLLGSPMGGPTGGLVTANYNLRCPVNETDLSTYVPGQMGGALRLNQETLSIVAGANHDFALTGTGAVYYIDALGGIANITGFADGYQGRYIIIQNQSGQVVTLNHENVGSAAAYRLFTQSHADVAMADKTSATLVYVGGMGRWVVLTPAA